TRDKTGSDLIPFTQEFFGQMLGVRRTTVSEAVSKLQAAGLIDTQYGQIQIVKRREFITLLGGNPNPETKSLDGAEDGRRMHVPAGPIPFDRNAIDCSCLSLPLVPARDRNRACPQRSLYEADRVVHTAAEPEIVVTPSASGKGQKIARCPTCRIA